MATCGPWLTATLPAALSQPGPVPPTSLSSHVPNLHLPHPATTWTATRMATATVTVLTIAVLPSCDLATPDLECDWIFDSVRPTGTAAGELDPVAPVPSCDGSGRGQPWVRCLPHRPPTHRAHAKSHKTAPTQAAHDRVAACTGGTHAGWMHGGSTLALGGRTGRGCRSFWMVVGGVLLHPR